MYNSTRRRPVGGGQGERRGARWVAVLRPRMVVALRHRSVAGSRRRPVGGAPRMASVAPGTQRDPLVPAVALGAQRGLRAAVVARLASAGGSGMRLARSVRGGSGAWRHEVRPRRARRGVALEIRVRADVGHVRFSYNPYFSAYFFFQPEQYFSLTSNQPEQCFGLFFSETNEAVDRVLGSVFVFSP